MVDWFFAGTNPNLPTRLHIYVQSAIGIALTFGLIIFLTTPKEKRRYLRVRLFQKLLSVAQPFTRRGRMGIFASLFDLKPQTRIIDLGGTSEIWQLVETPLDITIVNLPGVDRREKVSSHHKFTFLEGDATALPFPDNSFAIAFSNSVIEHVGGPENERKFAAEARRIAPSYYVQTPSIWFPLEVHTGIPFWWAMPQFVRSMLHRRWRRMLPAWNDMIEGTTVLRKSQFQAYFPDGIVKTERLLGMPKSYFVYRRGSV